jgi:hypothetical protein
VQIADLDVLCFFVFDIRDFNKSIILICTKHAETNLMDKKGKLLLKARQRNIFCSQGSPVCH